MISGFSFLGLGLAAGTPEWGAMLNQAKSNFYFPCARFKTTAFRRSAFSVNMCEEINIQEK
jgi:ABC-type dipeptide/oligopeptide/nickel transport system permease subunit